MFFEEAIHLAVKELIEYIESVEYLQEKSAYCPDYCS